MRSWPPVVPTVVGLCLLAACTFGSDSAGVPEQRPRPIPSSTATTDPGLADFYDQQVDRRGCRGGFECTEVRVPVDYAAPRGAAISLSVVRLSARAVPGSAPCG